MSPPDFSRAALRYTLLHIVGIVLMVVAWVLAFTERSWWAYALVVVAAVGFVAVVFSSTRHLAARTRRAREGR